MRFPFFRNRDSVKNGILISIRRTGDGFHPGLFTNGVNVYHYLTYLLEKMPSDRMSDEELELLAPWNENVKTEIQHRVNNTDQSDVNCQGTPATEK